jgi:hypothetical protein
MDFYTGRACTGRDKDAGTSRREIEKVRRKHKCLTCYQKDKLKRSVGAIVRLLDGVLTPTPTRNE